jgi:hypothetical protein
MTNPRSRDREAAAGIDLKKRMMRPAKRRRWAQDETIRGRSGEVMNARRVASSETYRRLDAP